MNPNTKQVIVVRKDLNMRKGKIAAQASHAAMAFLTKELSVMFHDQEWLGCTTLKRIYCEEISHWLKNSFKKVCVSVDSEEELDELYQKAIDSKLMCHMIIDNGATEFKGVATKTCIAIGPHWDRRFEGLTDHLKLL